MTAARDWPAIFEKILASNILVLAGLIWLGDNSSVMKKVHERLYGGSHLLNDEAQYQYYARVGGCLIIGNEDGVKHCAQNVLYTLQHIGYTIPPQADAGWIGEAGPGPSYLDPGSGGPENDFTNRNATFMTWNSMHLAWGCVLPAACLLMATSDQDGMPGAAKISPIPSTADSG
jgi:multimeric flavodoxin WrbA